ncbi:MAG TPA: hypothetical protein ENJ95_23755, partial [Bacteroidetes bacterium]|nr:hypothetical protein [Bacteroidota bacterium]
MNRYLLVLSLLTAPLFLSAQQGYSIYKGTVTDRETNETLPYVHIAWSGSQYGTVANEEGAFQIKIPDSNMGDTMVFSFMGYEPYYLPATKKLPQNKKLRIALAPATQELSMIEVSPVDAKKVVQATIKNIPKNYTKRPFLVKGFFRESGIREDTGREFLFAEGVILTHKNQHGDIDRGDYVSLLKGYRKKLQYDLRVDGQTYQLPQVTQGAYIGVRLDIVRDPGFFLSKKRYRDYEYEYERTDILNGKQIYVIRFYPKEGSKQAWLKGLLFVEKEQYAVVKASYEYTKSARAYYNKSEAADILKLQQRKFEAAYFQYKGKWFLKNARIKTKYTESWTSVPLAINMDFIATAVETNIKLDNDKQNIKLDTKNIIPYNRAFAFNERLEKAGDGFWGSDNILERLQQPNDKTEMQNIDSTLFSINIKTTPALPANEKEPAAKTPKPVPQVFLLPEQSPFEKKMENYYLNYLPEKVFVHTDKNIYAGGETIWMAIYLMDGRSHRPGTYSNLVRVELHNAGDEVVAQQNLLSEDGHTSGQFDLPADIVPGEYQLTAFTNYQRNSGDEILFKKTIRIIGGLKESGGVEIEAPVSSAPFSRKKKEKVRLRFFPEGGDCLNGHLCKMALIAENASGRPMQINAVLRDGEGQEVNEIKTGKNGMGSFIYLPVKGKEFYATIEGLGKAYDIPPALDEGFHLGLQHLKQEVRLSLKTNRPKGLAGARITVHLRGRVLIDQALSN